MLQDGASIYGNNKDKAWDGKRSERMTLGDTKDGFFMDEADTIC